MPGLDPGIHAEREPYGAEVANRCAARLCRRMDCRIKSGNDEVKIRISLPVGPGYARGSRVRGDT